MNGISLSIIAVGSILVLSTAPARSQASDGAASAFAQAPRAVPAAPPSLPSRVEQQMDPQLFEPRTIEAPTRSSGGGSVMSSAAGDYVLTTADTVEMSIFREPDLTTRSKVGSDGTIQLPLVREVKVAGMTVREAQEAIRRLYDADYLVNPQVVLNVVDFAQRQFTILGQVLKPGSYPFPGGRSLGLLEAVGLAGGFTRSADRSRVMVRRSSEGGAEGSIKVNAKKLSVNGRETFNIQPGDVITVGESWF